MHLPHDPSQSRKIGDGSSDSATQISQCDNCHIILHRSVGIWKFTGSTETDTK